jgi:hypothetical protein
LVIRRRGFRDSAGDNAQPGSYRYRALSALASISDRWPLENAEKNHLKRLDLTIVERGFDETTSDLLRAARTRVLAASGDTSELTADILHGSRHSDPRIRHLAIGSASIVRGRTTAAPLIDAAAFAALSDPDPDVLTQGLAAVGSEPLQEDELIGTVIGRLTELYDTETRQVRRAVIIVAKQLDQRAGEWAAGGLASLAGKAARDRSWLVRDAAR